MGEGLLWPTAHHDVRGVQAQVQDRRLRHGRHPHHHQVRESVRRRQARLEAPVRPSNVESAPEAARRGQVQGRRHDQPGRHRFRQSQGG